MESPTTKKYTEATLSPSSQYHLGTLDATTAIRSQVKQRAKSESEAIVLVHRRNTDARFTIFLKLPIELQVKIWKDYIEAEPRLVALFIGDPGRGPRGYRYPILMQINRATSDLAIKLLGYKTMEIRYRGLEGGFTDDETYIFKTEDLGEHAVGIPSERLLVYPETDELYIGFGDAFWPSQRARIVQLIEDNRGIMAKIKSVTVDAILFLCPEPITALQKFESLELFCIEVDSRVTQDTRFTFERIGHDEITIWTPILNVIYSGVEGNFMDYINSMLARGPNGLVPRIELVKKRWADEGDEAPC